MISKGTLQAAVGGKNQKEKAPQAASMQRAREELAKLDAGGKTTQSKEV